MGKTPEEIVNALFGRSAGRPLKRAVWPNRKWAEELPKVISHPDVSCQDLIGAFKLLKSEYGLSQAVQKHGLQALWSADVSDCPDAVVGFGAYCFQEQRLDFLGWLMDEGFFGASDVLPSGKSVMLEALRQSGGYLLWLADKGGRLDKLQEEIGDKSLFVAFAENYRWEPWAFELCERALKAGIDPWKKDRNGEYPIIEAMSRGGDDVCGWMLDRASACGVEMGASLARELLGAAKCSRCAKMAERLRSVAEACEMKERIEQAQAKELKGLADFGALALSLAREGRVSVDGVEVGSKEDMEKVAKQGSRVEPLEKARRPGI